MAANDGASGVAVMLELARVLSADKKLSKDIGVDFVSSTLRTPERTATTTAGLSEHSISPLISPRDCRGTMASCSTWSAARALSSTRSRCRRSSLPTSSEGLERCRCRRLFVVLPDSCGRSRHRRPHPAQQGRDSHRRHHSVLPRPARQLFRSDMAYDLRHDGAHRQEHAESCGPDRRSGALLGATLTLGRLQADEKE